MNADIFVDKKKSSGGSSSSGGSASWWIVIALVAFLVYQNRGKIPDIIPDPGPGPTPIEVERAAIMFALDGDNITDMQAQVSKSQVVRSYCDDNDIDYRRYEESEDLSKEDKQWREMMAAAKDAGLPSMVVVDLDSRGSVYDIPDSVDEVMDVLKELKQ